MERGKEKTKWGGGGRLIYMMLLTREKVTGDVTDSDGTIALTAWGRCGAERSCLGAHLKGMQLVISSTLLSGL